VLQLCTNTFSQTPFVWVLQLRPGHQRCPRKSFRDGSGYTLSAEFHKSQRFIFRIPSPTLSNCRKLQVKIKVHLQSQRPQGPVLISDFQGKQVTFVIILEADCHYFLPGQQLPFQFQSVSTLGQYQVIVLVLLGEERHVCEGLALGLCMTAEWPEIEHASFRSLLQCPSYCTTMPHPTN